MTNASSADPLAETARLAGFFAAHAIWSLSSGEALVPIYGFLRGAGLRELTRLEHDDLEAGVAAGRELLRSNEVSAQHAVLVFDGQVKLGEESLDAVVIEGQSQAAADERLEMIVPYRSAAHADGFRVHPPKFVDLAGSQERRLTLSQAFFRGVNEHREAAPIWRDHAAESR
ncbi:MAG TPA: hypothetical protein DCY89_00185 [Gammaproteobacteria bacterium]|nr:hypothetical protein [Gammaproteobacteria bacterium]